VENLNGVPNGFQWSPEFDAKLEHIASTDLLHEEWPQLREIIKYKIQKNIDMFLESPEYSAPKQPPPFVNRPETNGGLRLPPVRPRPRNPANPIEARVSYMTRTETEEAKAGIFAQLDEFEENAPFTIQRICELCIRPQEHYKAVGKYLRAVEKTLLVTSTWDSFPNPVSSEVKANGNGPTTTPLSIGPLSAPTTPIFSPIPFLHSDARARSKSRSPTRTLPGEPNEVEPAFGRVDELDDPRPGHLSDGPTPISSTTTIATTLQDRFVKGEDQEQGQGKTEAVEEEDKKEVETKGEGINEQSVDEKMDEDQKETEEQKPGKEDKVAEEGGSDKENQA